MRPISLCEGYQNKASIFAIVCSVLKCSFDLEIRDKRYSWVAAFVATRVAPVPCQPPAGRQLGLSKCYISRLICALACPSGPSWLFLSFTRVCFRLTLRSQSLPFSVFWYSIFVDFTLGYISLSYLTLPHTHETYPPSSSSVNGVLGGLAGQRVPSPRVFRESCLLQV